MVKPGRVSAAALSIVPSEALLPGSRPAPPEDLSRLERAVWQTTVDRMAPDWFTVETFPVLKAYCRVVVQSDQIGKELGKFQGGFPRTAERWKKYRELSRMQTVLQAQIGNFSSKLRLTHQSRYDRRVSKREAPAGNRPWEYDGSE